MADPILILWVVTVAQRLGFDNLEALSLGAAVDSIYLNDPRSHYLPNSTLKTVTGFRQGPDGYEFDVVLLGCRCASQMTADGIRATDTGDFPSPESVEEFLVQRLGAGIIAANASMRELAERYIPEDLALRAATLYELFKPEPGQALHVSQILWTDIN